MYTSINVIDSFHILTVMLLSLWDSEREVKVEPGSSPRPSISDLSLLFPGDVLHLSQCESVSNNASSIAEAHKVTRVLLY